MPDIPEAALASAAEAMCALHDLDPAWAEVLARAALEAAAPILAEAWGATAERKPGGTRDPRAAIPCRRCGAQPGRACVTSSGTRAPVVHAERRNDWRRAEGQTAGMMDPEGTHMDRFPPPKEVPGA
jgi:hypothetical protein